MTRLRQAGTVAFTLLSTCGVLGWASPAFADPIRIGVSATYPVGQPSAGSLEDQNGDGVADGGWYYMFVAGGGGGFEERGFAEYDVRPLAGASIQHAWFQAPFENGFYDPQKQISGLMYSGNGQFDLSDYSIGGEEIGLFTIPANAATGVVYFDVTASLQRLLAGGSQYAGVRFDAVGSMAPITLGGHAGETAFLYVDTAPSPTPEPASLLLLGTGAGLIAIKRRRGLFVVTAETARISSKRSSSTGSMRRPS